MVWVFQAPAQKPNNILWHFSTITLLAFQTHLCWTVRYSGIGVCGHTPKPQNHFLALCIPNTTILGIQKHFCWPVGYRGMGVWGAKPAAKQYFLALFQHHSPRFPTTPLLGCKVQWYGCLGRHPKTETPFSGIVHTIILGVQKHLCWTVGYSGLGVCGASPESK